ncbi:uncharacterized protein LOC109534907 [Dendroctonus ponderosae]|uniref:uncharacterized protein LOC109534907 n=1 Tax=Dendroctonus ponderosae TaxID=77166 RepID=UPI002035E714|nr:uncharacterized protein LOC109534907 [Dendroctonus ponderosae]
MCSKSFVSSGPICALCKQSHYLSKCDHFHKLAPPDRLAKAKELKVCINCLSKGHFVNQCNSTFTCRLCGSKHHTSLHIKSKEPSVEQLPAFSHAEIPDRSRTISAFSSNTTQVLLPTAIGKIMDSTGKLYKIRILLDSGSQSNFIKSSLYKKLKLPVQSINASISGLAQASSLVHSKCDVEVHANQSPFKLQLSCLVLDEITGSVPGICVDLKHFKIPDNIRLLDPSFGEPNDINILLGASTFFNILCIGQVRLGSNLPVLQKTRFGWVVSGPVGYHQDSRVQCHLSCTEELPDQLNKFWELEHYPSTKALSSEEKACESHYLQNTKRNSDGRFVVSIPFKAPVELLGDSYKIAEKRFLSLEKRFQLNPRLYEQYSRFMKEYEELEHMTETVPHSSEVCFYLPHHGVLKEDSLTTKLRVVFNGSMPSTTGHSLNSLQMVGPVIQQDLFSILIRFRRHRYAVSADIEKMYRPLAESFATRFMAGNSY